MMAIKENIPNQEQGPDPTKPMQLVCEVVRTQNMFPYLDFR